MKMIEGNITSPKGFKATGVHGGIKKRKKDLTLIASDKPATVAGCFTQNIVRAAPVVYDQKIVAAGKKVKGIVINSGNANACAGKQSLADAEEMAAHYGALLGVKPEKVLVCPTGVIGVKLPMDLIKKAIDTAFPLIGNSFEDGILAAEGIMTTDTFMKTVAVEVQLGGKTVTLGGMAKGSGMIHPNMATLLSFVTTDAAISGEMLQKALSDSVKDSYNMISVDSDTSTNDTALVLANGMAGNAEITRDGEDYQAFAEALRYISLKLARDIARDGEGATKLMEVKVSGASSEANARLAARSVVSSNLFKAALFGSDATWGRIMCAMGYSGSDFDPENVSISFGGAAEKFMLIDHGEPIVFDEERATEILSKKDVLINIDLHNGDFSATAWGCDLTYDYVKINGEYRS